MKRKTTYIVGAGASVEFGFPIGSDLTKEISDILRVRLDDFGHLKSGDKDVLRGLEEVLRHLPPAPEGKRWSLGYLYGVANRVSRNMHLALSIDNFLEAKKDKIGYADTGKLAIAIQILKHERESGLWVDPHKGGQTDFSRIKENWLLTLFRILSAQKGIDGFLSGLSLCHFITFNYDRVVEKFFTDAVQSYFELGMAEAQKAISENLNIFHVYGDLGSFSGGGGIEFGGGRDLRMAANASRNIRTFTEGVADIDKIGQATTWCEESDTIIFMGFAFLPLNLRAIRPQKMPGARKRVYGTVYGMSEDNTQMAELLLRRTWFDGSPHIFSLRPVTCQKLIAEISGYLGEYDLEA